MSQITRRSILGGIAATAAPLPAIAAPAPVLSPRERMQAALEELKAAAFEANPGIKKWQCHWDPDDKDCLHLMILAFNN
ncbi:hypothetical protein QN219_25395 [Sinorhizobium sp. 7-81]|uniref:hypothetical protein n=1 Tax=Sinorhizobium sp. 8-89 TaxID=3049089 RepID=UPI0024C3EC9D|nr:hypothetical protein [Sinorhizobium sp. 8-89]MDK1493343.1 hypothetical protein [Sinorhizobium sp. 8-89]